jgi:hypothetical protein
MTCLVVFRRTLGSQKAHRNILEAFIALNQMAQVVTGNSRHHDIQDQDRGGYLRQYLECLSDLLFPSQEPPRQMRLRQEQQLVLAVLFFI